MAKKNSSYWRERFELLENALHNDAMQIMPDIDHIYKQAQADIETQIRAWYQRLADNNGVSMAEARKLLTANELKEFNWSVEEYIKHGKENAIDQRWMKQLENASARVHISRLEALKLQVQQSIESVYGNQLDLLDHSMRRLYQDGYYRTAFELQKGFEIGWPIAAVDQNKLDKIIARPWAPDGKNFSSRVWNNRTKLINELHTELSRMCVTGAAPDRAIKNIAKKMNTSRANAGRLVMTEAAYFGSVSQKDCFNDLDVEQYEICATLDSRTSAVCQDMDGKVFDMKDYEAGVTAPPFHVYCRSCTCPYFNDEFTVDEMRAARGEEGKTYYVPADIKYPEWKRQFASGSGTKQWKGIDKGSIIKNIDIDDMEMLAYGKDIDKDVIKTIYNTLKPGERNGDYFISEVAVKSIISSDGGTVLLQIEPIPAGKTAMLRLNINQDAFAGKTLDHINKMIADAPNIVAENLKEAAIHESGHAKLISGLGADEIEELYEELKEMGISSISKTAKTDGSEAIAEIEVLIDRGEQIPKEAEALYDKYVRRKQT